MTDLNGGVMIFPPIELPPEIVLQRVLCERDAAAFVGLSAMTLERMRKLGTAPKHLVLSPRRLGYRVADLLKWLDERAAAGSAAA